MSKSQTVLTLMALVSIGCVADAQTPTCKDGACTIQSRAGHVPQDTQPRNYGYSHFDAAPNFSGRISSFAEACEECGRVHSQSPRPTGAYTNARPYDYYSPSRTDLYRYNATDERDYRAGYRPTVRPFDHTCYDCNDPNCQCDTRGTNYQPRANYGRSDYRDNFFEIDRDRYRSAPRSQFDAGNQFDPRGQFDNRRSFEPRRQIDRRDQFDQRGQFDVPGRRDPQLNFNSRDRYDSPDFRYSPTTDGPRRQYNYTSTRQPISNVIRWQNELGKSSQWAKQNQRPLVVTFTADWCSHCKTMKAQTWQDARVARAINTGRFVPVRIDADANRELLSRLAIQSLPTTLIVRPDLKITERMQGFRTADQVVQALVKYSRSVKKDSDTKIALK